MAKKKVKSKAKKILKTKVKPKAEVKTQPAKKARTQLPTFANLLPLDERLLVEIENSAEKLTPGGLYIPGTVNVAESYKTGVVRRLGRGHQNKKGFVRPLEVQVGEAVTFPSYAGTEVDWNGQKLVIIKESELLGVLSSKKGSNI